jgi:hypothetical protein
LWLLVVVAVLLEVLRVVEEVLVDCYQAQHL